MDNYDIAIIGAGPAGIMASISASKNGARVLLLEKNANLGRKLLITGNGRCNLTNKNIETSRYHGSNPKFVEPVFAQFNYEQTITFFESLGIVFKEENHGRIFPRTNQATTIVQALEHEIRENKIHVMTKANVNHIIKDKPWKIDLENHNSFIVKNIIVTTGGKAAHQFGSSGDGLFWSKNLGHTIKPLYASLVPAETTEAWPTQLQGLKVESTIRGFYENRRLAESTGDLLFTHYGLSGPAIMSISGDIAALVSEKPNLVRLEIDFIPEIGYKDLKHKINTIFRSNGAKSICNNLRGMIPQGLLELTLDNVSIAKGKKSAEISQKEIDVIINSLKSTCLHIKNLRPLKEAQVTRGGISLDEVDNHTLESKIVKGIFFAGEILDIDGDSGGFNLQWAWSSGYVAGIHASFLN